MAEAEKPKEEVKKPAGGGAPKGPLLIGLVNTIAILGMLGMVVFTKVMYKRPKITESGERQQLADKKAAVSAVTETGQVEFKPFTVNIGSTPVSPRPAEGTTSQIQGKLHYATVGFVLEVRDIALQSKVDEIKPVFMDQLLHTLGKKDFNELTSVQGRYILRTELIEIANKLLKQALVTNVFFTQFIVQ